ncbi:MAG TPA: hypothetical protein PLT66_05190 [Bacillota bacterium]|nr:hypothetical protein [Bacillota bacterium]
MKRIVPILVLVLLLSSCAGASNGLDSVVSAIAPPVRMVAVITYGGFTSQAEICFYSPDSEIIMTTEFLQPEEIGGLLVERHSDMKLYASYDGLLSELSEEALNVVTLTNDILQAVRDNLETLGERVEPDDERYAQAQIVLGSGTITVYYDEATGTILRINSDMFASQLKIDIIETEKITASNQNVSALTSG